MCKVYNHGTILQHERLALDTARAAFFALRGGLEAFERADQIERLPTVEWRGRRLYTIRCNGTSGRGPHIVNVPESLLWNLIDLRAYRCVYHAGD